MKLLVPIYVFVNLLSFVAFVSAICHFRYCRIFCAHIVDCRSLHQLDIHRVFLGVCDQLFVLSSEIMQFQCRIVVCIIFLQHLIVSQCINCICAEDVSSLSHLNGLTNSESQRIHESFLPLQLSCCWVKMILICIGGEVTYSEYIRRVGF